MDVTSHDFIEVYPGALDAAVCGHLIERFEKSGEAQRGQVGSGVDVKLKNSYDITITGKPNWRDVNSMLQQVAFIGFQQYIRKYPYLLIGPMAAQFMDPKTKEVRQVTADNLGELDESSFNRILMSVFRPGSINIQKYIANEGGYPHWHSEIYPRDPSADTLHRALLFTIYLNNVPEAGETEFFYQNRKIKPEVGSLLIAPAGFTHTHRGNMPVGGDKYIATSWILFQRAEAIYGNAGQGKAMRQGGNPPPQTS
jgi:hypothetical protein